MQIAREILRQEVQQGGLRGTESLRVSFSQAGSKPRHFRLDYGNKALSLTAAGSELIIKLLGAPLLLQSRLLGVQGGGAGGSRWGTSRDQTVIVTLSHITTSAYSAWGCI